MVLTSYYRPQSIGMLERQHRPLKDSLKAAIEDMGQKYQDFKLFNQKTRPETYNLNQLFEPQLIN